MKLVRESIAFQRYKDPKRALFGLIPGQLVKYTTDNIDGPMTIVGIFLEGEPNFMRLGHFSTYDVPGIQSTLIMPGSSTAGKLDEKDLNPLTPEETKIVKKALNSPRAKIILKNIEERYNIKPILESVSFERYKDPKHALFGFRPGQLVKYNPKEDGKHYYVSVYHDDYFSEMSPDYASVINIGKLHGTDVKLDLNPNGPYGILGYLKPLTAVEKNAVMQELDTPNGKRIIKELEKRWPVKLIKESSFERYKDPKHALFGFRLGQLVVGNNAKNALGYDIDCIIQIVGDECTIASFGRFQRSDKNGELYFNRVTGMGDWFEPLKNLRPLDKKEKDLMEEILTNPKNKDFIKLKEGQYMILTKGYHSDLIPENERIKISL